MLPAGVQLSVAPGSDQFTVAPQLPGLALTVMLEGQPDITGARGSTTVTMELHVLLPKVFDTVSITLFVPRSAQLNKVLLRVFVTLQPELLPLSTIAGVRVAFPEAFRARVVFLHRATRFDSVAPVE